MPQTQSASGNNPRQINRAQRMAVIDQSVPMRQQIYSGAVNLASQTVLNIPLRNAGLLKKLIVKVTGTVNNTGSTTAITPTQFGLANVLSQVVLTDLNNNTRIQTSGIHLALLASLKQRFSQGGSLLASALAQFGNIGNNFNVIQAAASIAAGGNAPFSMYFEIPASYSDEDLRGAIYMNVVNAVANLQLTFNSAPVVSSGDETFAVYGGNTGNLSNVVVTVYQDYLDQLPVGKNGVILPMLDLSTVYELKNTTFTGLTPNQDYPFPFANFREFISTFLIYNNNGTTLGQGADVNYLALQSANFTNLQKVDPITAAYAARQILGADVPNGTYYFSFRKKRISTRNYGNMQLILNPITASTGNYAQVLWEDFALVNTLQQAGSLAG